MPKWITPFFTVLIFSLTALAANLDYNDQQEKIAKMKIEPVHIDHREPASL